MNGNMYMKKRNESKKERASTEKEMKTKRALGGERETAGPTAPDRERHRPPGSAQTDRGAANAANTWAGSPNTCDICRNGEQRPHPLRSTTPI